MSCKLPLAKYQGKEIKYEMGGACGTHGNRNAHRALAGKISIVSKLVLSKVDEQLWAKFI